MSEENIVLDDNQLICTLTKQPKKADNKELNLQSIISMLNDEYGFELTDMERDYTVVVDDDIIKNRFISAATLNRRFRKYVRLSPKKFLESKKLSYAAKLLSDGASVTDACLASGFSDCSHFIALFKKQFGKTPFKYKKEVIKH